MIMILTTFDFDFVKRHYALNSAKMSGSDEQKAITAGSSAGNKKRRHDDLDDRAMFDDRVEIEMSPAHKASFLDSKEILNGKVGYFVLSLALCYRITKRNFLRSWPRTNKFLQS